jgi:hypothetical protein
MATETTESPPNIVLMNGQVVDENLTISQKEWLEKIGYFQATIITSQPTEWDNKLPPPVKEDHKIYFRDRSGQLQCKIIEPSDQNDEKTSVVPH